MTMWLEFPQYAPAASDDIAIVIAFFSPCNFQRPRENILRTVEKLLHAKYPVVVVEAVYPDAPPLVLPAEVHHRTIHVGWQSVLFLKENLFNVAIAHTTHPKLVFIDGDIEFSDPHWLNKTDLLLDTHDLIQPFEKCYWLDETNTSPMREKNNCVQPILEKTPLSGVAHHPGFAWAARRDFLERVGGLYDRHPLGGSDTALWYTLMQDADVAVLLQHCSRTNDYFADTTAYKAYRSRVRDCSPRINYLAGNVVQHFWHGTADNRQYVTRNLQYMPDPTDGEYPLRVNSQGVLEWTQPEYAERALAYFQSRREDG
jgi:hypothetical protein